MVLQCVVFASIILFTSHHSSVILTSRFEAALGLYWDGPRNFEPRSDDERLLQLAPPSKIPHHTNGRAFGTLRMILRETGPIHVGSLVELGFEPGTFRPQSPDLTTRLPRPAHKPSETNLKKYFQRKHPTVL
ncbi:hypothetical protein AVEN_218804-1 [Araneus ventricosus]|uniref:Uncharacterized protein n=1 Tax=Araneus ventricosus TaxID=182803 RepID=A0A4Y2B6N8_ARAVE|nr:hypothetical protein AVEN_218804-1 [Araneus ventricosus]